MGTGPQKFTGRRRRKHGIDPDVVSMILRDQIGESNRLSMPGTGEEPEAEFELVGGPYDGISIGCSFGDFSKPERRIVLPVSRKHPVSHVANWAVYAGPGGETTLDFSGIVRGKFEDVLHPGSP